MVSHTVYFVLLALLGLSAAQYNGFENNLVEFDVPLPLHLNKGIGVPYAYQEIKPVYGPLTAPAPAAVPALPAPALAPTAVVASKLGLVGTVVSHAISFVHAAISCLISNAPAIIVGVITSLGLCKFTHICTKLSTIQSVQEIEEQVISFATPERIARAAEFVQGAIKKYGKTN